MKEQIEELENDITEYYGVDPMYYGVQGAYLAKFLCKKGWRKQEWISVEERLPENDGFVLLCTSKGSIIKGHYEHKYGRWSGLNNRFNVTHWMPLPEAPKGGAE